jgi:Na+/phosphate symporter
MKCVILYHYSNRYTIKNLVSNKTGSENSPYFFNKQYKQSVMKKQSEKDLLIYLENQINKTNAHISSVTDSIVGLNKSIQENEGRDGKYYFELEEMLEEYQIELDSYLFRLDWLKTQLQSFNDEIEFNEWKSNRK